MLCLFETSTASLFLKPQIVYKTSHYKRLPKDPYSYKYSFLLDSSILRYVFLFSIAYFLIKSPSADGSAVELRAPLGQKLHHGVL